ncbi:MAG: hypothetical protein WAT12_01365 [Candidatus Nitrotoga sp.]
MSDEDATQPTIKLPSKLKTKINKIAHTAGLNYGEQTKRRLPAEIEKRLTAGAEIIRRFVFCGAGGEWRCIERIFIHQPYMTTKPLDVNKACIAASLILYGGSSGT